MLVVPLLSACSVAVSDTETSSDPEATVSADEALSNQSWKIWRPAAGTVYTNIPVCFEPNSGLTSAEKTTIKTHANNSWPAYSRVRFTGWNECTYTCDYTVTTSCSSD